MTTGDIAGVCQRGKRHSPWFSGWTGTASDARAEIYTPVSGIWWFICTKALYVAAYAHAFLGAERCNQTYFCHLISTSSVLISTPHFNVKRQTRACVSAFSRQTTGPPLFSPCRLCSLLFLSFLVNNLIKVLLSLLLDLLDFYSFRAYPPTLTRRASKKMANPAPRPSLSPDQEVNPAAIVDNKNTIKTRRSSLNFFRRVSGDKQSTSPPRTTMLFKKSSVKEEVAPVPRIASFHFDNLTNYRLQFDNNNNDYNNNNDHNNSTLPTSNAMPFPPQQHNSSPRRYQPSALGHTYNSPDKSAMPPIPQTPITPPAQHRRDPFERSTTMSSMMTSDSMKDRGRYGYSAPATTLSNSPRRLRRKKDAQPYK
jgi:hypothetical protein